MICRASKVEGQFLALGKLEYKIAGIGLLISLRHNTLLDFQAIKNTGF